MIHYQEHSTESLDLATDAEACAYLYTASLEFPLDSDWTQIYLYVATRYLTGKVAGGVPDDIRVTELTRNQLDDLNRLKRWIVGQQRNHLAHKRQEEKRQEKHEQGLPDRDDTGGVPFDPGTPMQFDFGSEVKA